MFSATFELISEARFERQYEYYRLYVRQGMVQYLNNGMLGKGCAMDMFFREPWYGGAEKSDVIF